MRQPPDKQRGGPVTTRNRPHTANHPEPSVTRRREPTAYASVFSPQGNRAWYWLTFRCPVCGSHVFARSRRLDEVARSRKTTCGHRVVTVAARIYGTSEAA